MTISHRPAMAFLALCCTLSLAACGQAEQTEQASAQSTAQSQSQGAYPVTIENCGRELTFTQAPERTVSLNQSSTEIQLSLGLADKMVGTATWTDPVLEQLSADNERVPRLADNAASMESVLAQNPDFVTASFPSTLAEKNSGSFEDYKRLGVPAYLAFNQCIKGEEGTGDSERPTKFTIDEVYHEIRDLAAIHGVKEQGDELIQQLQDRLEKAVAGYSTKSEKPLRVVFWFANSESPYVAGGTGASQFVSDSLGLENVYADEAMEWPQVSWEDVAAQNPDILVIGDLTRKSQTAETAAAKIEYLKSNPVTAQMDAVKNDRFIKVAGGDMNPSIRTVDLAEKIQQGVAGFGL